MRAVFGFTLLAALCVAVAWWVSLLPGSVAITMFGTTVQASAPVGLTLFVALFAVLYLAVRFVVGLVEVPAGLRGWNRSKSLRRGNYALTRTLVALAANDTDAARREAGRTRTLLGETPLTLLLQAQAERQAGREEEAEAIFKRLAARPDARLLGLRGQLRMAAAREDWEAAAALAREADEAHPGSRWLTDERQRMALRTGRYGEALRLMGPNRRKDASQRHIRAALGVAAANAETDKAAALRLAKDAFEDDPSIGHAAIAYAIRLRAAGKERPAQEVLRRAWAINPQPDIADAFLSHINDKMARYRAASSLVNANPAHPDSALLLARTALDAGQLADARRHAETARSAGLNDRRLWLLLADIADTEGDRAAAQEALRQIPGARPEPAWRCESCGTLHQAWHPICDSCGTPGKITWVAMAPQLLGGPAPRLLPPATIEGLP